MGDVGPDIGADKDDNFTNKIREVDNPSSVCDDHDMMDDDDLEQENTQQFLTQQFEDSQSSLQDSNLFSPPQSPINPLTIPWGRLVPQNVQQGCAINNFDLLPRKPPENVGSATRSRSMSLPLSLPDINNNDNSNSHSPSLSIRRPVTQTPSEGINFLGLKQIKLYDRFNEYDIGRSQKCDIVASKRENASIKQKWIHNMISNTHCRIFCMLKNPNTNINTSLEVYIEDSSGNGTLVNNTTLLKRNERRILHTGDTICLLNPKIIQKKIRNATKQKEILDHYSFVFINLHQTCGMNVVGVGTKNREDNGDDTVTMGNNDNVNVKGRCTTPTNIYNKIGLNSGRKRGLVDVRGTRSRSPSSSPLGLHSKIKDLNQDINDANSGISVMPPPEKRLKINASPPLSSSTATTASLAPRHNKPNGQSTRKLEAEYDLRDEIGSGTCGQVRRAIHRKTGEMVAVKIIAIGNAGGRNRRASAAAVEIDPSIQAEAAILQSLDHPYIVKLVDVFIHPGKAVYLVMELLHGGDLFDRIVSKGRYTEVESRRVTRRMLAAVHYLHSSRDIVHRDLKPENILCVSRNDDVHVKLSDFGLAKNITDDGLKTFCGTPQYFAPEVLRRRNTIAGRGRYGKEADMWSLGVILYILLSGVPPFDGSDMDAVAAARITFHGPRWEGISRGAKHLVSLLLESEPDRRISVNDACSHEWIMTQDGDTHVHPLDDPVIKKDKPDGTTTASIKEPAEQSVGLNSPPDAKISSSRPQSVLTSPIILAARGEPRTPPTVDDRLQEQPTTPNQSANFPTPPRSEKISNITPKKQEGESLLSVVKQLSQVGESKRLKAGKENEDDHGENADSEFKGEACITSNDDNSNKDDRDVMEEPAQDPISPGKINAKQTTLSSWFKNSPK